MPLLPGDAVMTLSVIILTRIAQVAERRARNPEVRGSNPGSGSSFALEIL